MRRSFVAGLLIAALAAGGCGGGSGGGGSSVAGATPQDTFDGMKAAAAKKDWTGMVSGMTPETQDLMLGGMTMMVQFMGMVPGGADKLKGANDILTKHGVKLDATPALPDLTGGDPTKANPQDAMKKLTAGVKDKAACLGELMSWLEKNGDENTKKNMNSDDIATSTLSDVKIDGDTASGKLTSKKDGKDQTQDVHFKKIDGKWYADMTADMKK